MDIRQMVVFREVMLTGSVSDAARHLSRTQPAVSLALARLEERLGLSLFERRAGRLYPTPEAHFLHKKYEAILAEIENTEDTIHRMKAIKVGELRIASMPGPSVALLPQLISRHLGDREGVQVTLLSRSSDSVARLVESQQFDIGVADHDPRRTVDASLTKVETFDFEFLCAIQAQDPLAAKETIDARALSQRPMAGLFTEHQSHSQISQAFEDAGADYKVRFTGQFFLPLLTYVERGHACLIVDPMSALSWLKLKGLDSPVQFRPFAPKITFSADILTPRMRPQSQTASYFIGHLREALARIEQDLACLLKRTG